MKIEQINIAVVTDTQDIVIIFDTTDKIDAIMGGNIKFSDIVLDIINQDVKEKQNPEKLNDFWGFLH